MHPGLFHQGEIWTAYRSFNGIDDAAGIVFVLFDYDAPAAVFGFHPNENPPLLVV